MNYYFPLILIQLIAICGFSQTSQHQSDTIHANQVLIIDQSDDHFRKSDLSLPQVGHVIDPYGLKLYGGTVAGALGRLSGVSFQSGGLLSVRGLSPRYATVAIDGLSAPVTEQNVKAFGMGYLPSAAGRSMTVLKSGDYASHAEWGGANVHISTKAYTPKNFNSLSLGSAMQMHFSFDNFFVEKAYGGGADFLGFGADQRDFTNDIASRADLQSMSRNEAAAQGALMQNTWMLERTNAAPSMEFDYTMGRVVYNNNGKYLSTINALSFQRSQTGSDSHKAKYTGYVRNEDDVVESSALESYMSDGKYSTKASLKANSGWYFKLNPKHQFNANISYAHTGDNVVLNRYFIGLSNDKEAYFSQFGLTEKYTILGRLTGEHDLSEATHIDWSLGIANASRREPDLRRTAYQRSLQAPNDPFYLVIPESSKADAGARFSSDMNDMFYSGRVDLVQQINPNQFDLRAGVLFETNNRTFDSRIITSAKDDFTDPSLRFVTPDQLETVFSPENYGADGYYLVDGTTDYDAYDASSTLIAAYVGAENEFFDRLSTSLGVRAEYYGQTLESGDIDVDNASTEFLPYINGAYQLNQQSSVKFAFSKSLNRPTFRELSKFAFYDFDYRADIQGNPDLLNAELYNIDVSYLRNFGRNEFISVTGFYKNIKNPIEMVYVVRSDQALFSFDNANASTVAGAEMEFSKYLCSQPGTLLSNIVLSGSFSYTYSNIDLGEDTRETAEERPLQGQIPLLANLGAGYGFNKQRGMVSIAYQYRGKSLYSVGDGQETFPWYLAQTNMLNGGVSYGFDHGIKVKFSAKNLLNTPYVVVEDANLNGSLTDAADNVVSRTENYQTYSVSVNFSF